MGQAPASRKQRWTYAAVGGMLILAAIALVTEHLVWSAVVSCAGLLLAFWVLVRNRVR